VAPAFAYRYDWETPEGGGHMRAPHTIEIQFVFNNIKIAGPLISKMPEAYALAEKTSAAWAAFARTGDPNTSKLPKWASYSATSRDTMLFNNECRVESDPDRGPRLVMEQILKLSSRAQRTSGPSSRCSGTRRTICFSSASTVPARHPGVRARRT
jgi:para-nitrobenzyl esterase